MSSPSERYAAARRRPAVRRCTSSAAATRSSSTTSSSRRCEALEDGYAVLVCAPTGAGKTVVGEFAVHLALAAGQKCFYTTPIKALSNQKYNDLVERYGADQVGLLTGDNAVNADAPIVVMTTEVLRNMLYVGSASLAGLGYVVMDEVHYLGDRFRGAVWEEVIIHLPAVGAAGLAVGHRVQRRGVRRVAGLGARRDQGDRARAAAGAAVAAHAGRHAACSTCSARRRQPDAVDPELMRYVNERMRYARPRRVRPPRRPARAARLAPAAASGRRSPGSTRDGLLPAITFIFSRAGCDAAVRAVRARRALADRRGRARRDRRRHRRAHRRHPRRGPRRARLLGVARRAAPRRRRAPRRPDPGVQGDRRGAVRPRPGAAVFATETLALGINMPARTVVLERLTKFNGETHADITPGEYTQLTGRAGRRGIDVEGHAVVLWSPEVDPARVAGLASTRTYPLRSSFRPSYNMAVNLVGQLGRAAARELLESSFAQFQADRGVAGLATQIRRNEETLRRVRRSRCSCDRGDFAEYAALRRAADRPRGRAVARGRAGPRAAPSRRRWRRCARATSSGCRPGGGPGSPSCSTRACIRATTRTRWWSPRRAGPAGCRCVDFPVAAEVLGRVRRAQARQPPLAAGAPRPRLQPARPRPAGRRRPRPTPAPAARRRRARCSGCGRELRAHPCHGCPDREEHCPLGRARTPGCERETEAAPPHRGPHRLARPHVRPDLRAARPTAATSPATRPRRPGGSWPGSGPRPTWSSPSACAPAPGTGSTRPNSPPSSRRWSTSRAARSGRSSGCRRRPCATRSATTVRVWADLADDEERARPAAEPRARARLRLGDLPLGPRRAAGPRARLRPPRPARSCRPATSCAGASRCSTCSSSSPRCPHRAARPAPVAATARAAAAAIRRGVVAQSMQVLSACAPVGLAATVTRRACVRSSAWAAPASIGTQDAVAMEHAS